MGEVTEGLSVLEQADKAIAAIFRLSKDLGIPAHLQELGVLEGDFAMMADNALKDGNAFSNPRKGKAKDIIQLFEQAF